MRKNLVELSLDKEFFSLVTEDFIKKFEVETGLQRIDSVHVHSNMARLGRIRLLSRAIIKFLKNLKRKDVALFEKEISTEMVVRYLSKTEDSYFGSIKPSETEQNLQTLANDLYHLKIKFNDTGKISKMTSFKILHRIFEEQCFVEDKSVKVKPSNKVSSGSVQNPSDPDAGYDGHKGQGYQTQIMETYSKKTKNASSEKDLLEAEKLNLITYVETESADNHDSHALIPAINHLQNHEIKCETILADAAYGSEKNVGNAKQKKVNIVAPVVGRTSEKGLELFEFDTVSYEITACPAGKVPDKIKHNKKSSITIIWYHQKCKENYLNLIPSHMR